jgi:hypothetical protein
MTFSYLGISGTEIEHRCLTLLNDLYMIMMIMIMAIIRGGGKRDNEKIRENERELH